MLSGKAYTVAYVGTMGIPCRYGGFETFVEEIATRLSKMGIRCVVYSTSATNQACYDAPPNVTLRRVPQIGWPPLDRVLRELYPLLDQLLRPADVVHILASSLFSPVWRIVGKRIVVSIDGFEWRRRSYNSLVRFLVLLAYVMALTYSNEITCDSKIMAGWVRSVFRRDARVISYGPRPEIELSKDEVQHFASAHGLSYGNYYLFVGRLVPEKGIRLLVKAFSQHPDKALAIVGSDPFGGRFERELRRMATPNVKFLGGLYGRDYVLVSLGALAQIRSTLDESEGVNPVTIEAMGFGLPIIASNVRQNREALGDCAVYFDANSEKTLHEAIEMVYSSEDLRRRLGGMAKERALNQYSWDAWFCELVGTYQSVVD